MRKISVEGFNLVKSKQASQRAVRLETIAGLITLGTVLEGKDLSNSAMIISVFDISERFVDELEAREYSTIKENKT
jgi:hypothetical protein